MKIAEAYVDLRVDARQAKTDARNESRAIAQEMTRQFAQFFSAAVVVNEIGKAINAASELEQAIGGTQAIFGESSRIIDDFARNAAQNAGLSERAFRSLTSQIGGLLNGLGFTQEESAKTSVELAQLGADLAATFGGRPEEAVQALGAALRGEFNPLERFGVSLRQSQINLRAVELGLATSTTQVDNNARAQAALSLITENTAQAQGQFGREAETAAGRQAILQARFEDLRAEIGTNLLPAFSSALGILESITGAFAALPGPVQTAVVAIAALAAVAGPINNVVRAFGGLQSAVGALRNAGPRIAGAVGVAGAALAVYALQAQNAQRRSEQFAEALDEVARASDADLLATFTESLLRGAFAGEEASEAIATLARENLGAAERVRDAVAATDAQAISIGGVTVTAQDLTAAIDAEVDAQGRANAATERSAELLDEQTGASEDATVAIEDLTDAYEEADEAAKSLAEAIDDVIGRSIDLSEAQDEAAAAVQELKGNIDEESKSLDGNTEAGRKNRDALREAGRAILDYGISSVRSGESVDSATEKVNSLIDGLRDQAIQAGLTEDEVDAYLETLGLTPESVETAIDLVGDRDAMGRVDDWQANLDDIPESERTEIEALINEGQYAAAEQRLAFLTRTRTQFVNVIQNVIGRIPGFGGFAAGGYVDRFTFSTLGEDGPEVVIPLTRPSRIRELLNDPRVSDPVERALAADARDGSAPPSTAPSSGSVGGTVMPDWSAVARTMARAYADEMSIMERTQ